MLSPVQVQVLSPTPRSTDVEKGRIGALVAALTTLSACGAGVITSDDVSPGEAAVIGVVALVAALYVFWVGGRGR